LLMIPAAMVIVEDAKDAWARGRQQLLSLVGGLDQPEAP
jgi:hypothetical protein